MSEERNFTSIQVSKETRDRLKELGLHPSESYENILVRLLDSKAEGQEVEYIIENAKDDVDCNVKAVVKWTGSEDDCVKYYDKNGNCTENVPNYQFDDKEFQVIWDDFRSAIESLENIVSILGILNSGESIQAGDVILSRI